MNSSVPAPEPPALERDLPALSDMADEELVTAHLRGRPGAFRELFERYRGPLTHFIERKTGRSERVQDILQDGWVRVTRHLKRFDTERKFSTWVYTIVANLCKNELRNRSRRLVIPDRALESRRDSDSRPIQHGDRSFLPDRLFEQRETRRLVEDAVEDLPPLHRRVFRLREIRGKSYQEVADLLGVRLGTVKSRLHRARTAFARLIRKRSQDAGIEA